MTKYYGKSRGVAEVSLSGKEGDFSGFIGPNGAGKNATIAGVWKYCKKDIIY